MYIFKSLTTLMNNIILVLSSHVNILINNTGSVYFYTSCCERPKGKFIHNYINMCILL